MVVRRTFDFSRSFSLSVSRGFLDFSLWPVLAEQRTNKSVGVLRRDIVSCEVNHLGAYGCECFSLSLAILFAS